MPQDIRKTLQEPISLQDALKQGEPTIIGELMKRDDIYNHLHLGTHQATFGGRNAGKTALAKAMAHYDTTVENLPDIDPAKKMVTIGKSVRRPEFSTCSSCNIKPHTIRKVELPGTKPMQAVIGSRTISTFDFSKLDLTHVITGGATGVDQAIEAYCKGQNIPVDIIKPDYQKHGKAATHIRNRAIIDRADVVYIIWDGQSKGTSSVIEYAYRKNKKRVIFNQNGEILFSSITDYTVK